MVSQALEKYGEGFIELRKIEVCITMVDLYFVMLWMILSFVHYSFMKVGTYQYAIIHVGQTKIMKCISQVWRPLDVDMIDVTYWEMQCIMKWYALTVQTTFSMQAAKEIAGTLSKSRNITYLPGGQNVLMGISTNAGQ